MPYDSNVKRGKGPGLAKAREIPVLVRRSFDLLHSSDYRVRQMFETADVMSEGATRNDRGTLTYFGTTSVLLPTTQRGGYIAETEIAQVTALLRLDPHARLRAVRIACREAQVRTGSTIGRVRAEIVVHGDRHGVRFDIDVEAPVSEAVLGVRETRRKRATE